MYPELFTFSPEANLTLFGKASTNTLVGKKWTNFPSLRGLLLSFPLSFFLFRLLPQEGDALSLDEHCCVCFLNRFSNSDLLFQFGTLIQCC